MKQHNKLLFGFIIIISSLAGNAQILSKSDAVSIALENNFDIRTAQNNAEMANNNAQITNSGYLPTVSGTGGANYSINNSVNKTQEGQEIELSGVATTRFNAGVNLNYTLFDGMGRKYNYQKLRENYNMSDLQARSVIENTFLNIFNSYYEIARLTQNQLNQEQTLSISRERLTKASYSYDYGQSTQLDVLNAEVDYNNDSINYLTIKQQLINEKNNLNLLLGRDVNASFDVDTTLSFEQGLLLDQLMENAKMNNVNVLLQKGNVRNANNDVMIASSAVIPKVGLNSGYSWQNNDFGPASFLAGQQANGVTVGATLSWNIWDGGISNTRKQNSRIALENQEIQMNQTYLNLERNVRNAWNIYQTALFVMEAESKNLETNQRNFDRTQEQYSLGQVTSIVFRQAQFNLLNAQLSYNRARYSAKIAELALLQLSGDIMSVEF